MQAPIPDNAILSDVYNEYSAGILDQSATLPERYNAGFRPGLWARPNGHRYVCSAYLY